MTPRDRFARLLTGRVLEIGPGSEPFPTAPGAVVRYADKSAEGGRDENFPELVGAPWGPRADIDVDIDRDGLRGVDDGSYDVVVACHVVEHFAAPVAALLEMERVLAPDGLLALVVPNRLRSFDALRAGTPLAHLLDEHARGVRTVDEDHIREFCASVTAYPPPLPAQVLDWHDVDKLDDERYAIHRRRSIHAHTWTAEEMAAALVGATLAGLGSWQLVDVFFPDDEGAAEHEFGLLLRRTSGEPGVVATAFVDAWLAAVLDDPARDPARAAAFAAALARDVAPLDAAVAARPAVALAAALARGRDDLAAAREAAAAAEGRATEQVAAARADGDRAVAALLGSPTHRAGRLVTAPARAVARRRRA